jgi:hypothetical protein
MHVYSVCVCACVYVCTYICMYIHTYCPTKVFTCILEHTYMYHNSTHACMCMYARIGTHLSVVSECKYIYECCKFLTIHLYVFCFCFSIKTQLFRHIHMYTYTYIHTRTQLFRHIHIVDIHTDAYIMCSTLNSNDVFAKKEE